MNLIGLRKLPKPTPMREVMAAYNRIATHDARWGTDPYREAHAAQALASGRAGISTIAYADGRLPVNSVGVTPARRQWRFRALDAKSGALLYEKIVESEDVEGARWEGVRKLMKEWRKYGAPSVDGVIGTVLAL